MAQYGNQKIVEMPGLRKFYGPGSLLQMVGADRNEQILYGNWYRQGQALGLYIPASNEFILFK